MAAPVLALVLRAAGPEVLKLANRVTGLDLHVWQFFVPPPPEPEELFIEKLMALPSALVKILWPSTPVVCAVVVLALFAVVSRALLGAKLFGGRRAGVLQEDAAPDGTEDATQPAKAEVEEGKPIAGEAMCPPIPEEEDTLKKELERREADHQLAMQAMQEKLAAAERERDAARLELEAIQKDAARRRGEHEEVQAWSISAAVTIKRLRKEVATLQTSLTAERGQRQAWMEAYDAREEELHRRELEIINRELRCFKEETWGEVAITELQATMPITPLADMQENPEPNTKRAKPRPPELTDWFKEEEAKTDDPWCRRGTGSTQVFSMDTPRTGEEDSGATWSSSEETTSEA